MDQLQDIKKEEIRKRVENYLSDYIGEVWQEILDMNTETSEEFDWAYEHLFTEVNYMVFT